MSEADAMAFRFLDLPAELRNRIYELVAIDDGRPTKLSLAPPRRLPPVVYAPLTKVCKEVRNEYLPMQRKAAHIIVFWDYVNAFSRTYLTPVSGKTWPPGHLKMASSPRSSEMYALGITLSKRGSFIDIAPIIRARLEHQYFHFGVDYTCFDCHKHEPRSITTQWGIMNFLILHHNLKWINDIRTGVIARVNIQWYQHTTIYHKKYMDGRYSDRFSFSNNYVYACRTWGLREAFLNEGCNGDLLHLGVI